MGVPVWPSAAAPSAPGQRPSSNHCLSCCLQMWASQFGRQPPPPPPQDSVPQVTIVCVVVSPDVGVPVWPSAAAPAAPGQRPSSNHCLSCCLQMWASQFGRQPPPPPPQDSVPQVTIVCLVVSRCGRPSLAVSRRPLRPRTASLK